MKRAIFLLTAFFALVMAANAQGLAVGTAMDNFSLSDTNGKTQTLADMKGKNGAVIIFVSAQCPVVRGYNARMNQIALDYAAKGINVIGINANATEAPALIKAHAEAKATIEAEGRIKAEHGQRESDQKRKEWQERDAKVAAVKPDWDDILEDLTDAVSPG